MNLKRDNYSNESIHSNKQAAVFPKYIRDCRKSGSHESTMALNPYEEEKRTSLNKKLSGVAQKRSINSQIDSHRQRIGKGKISNE